MHLTVARKTCTPWKTYNNNSDIDNNTILLKSYRKNLIEKLDSEQENECFVFISASVFSRTKWLIMYHPQVVLDYVILSENQDVVFRARGVGIGDASPFIINKSATNLNLAIERAMESIRVEEKQDL